MSFVQLSKAIKLITLILCLFFLWSFIQFSVLIWCPQISQCASNYGFWGGLTVRGSRVASFFSFSGMFSEVKNNLVAKKFCLLFWFLLIVEGLCFFLALEEEESIILVSRMQAKLLPSVRENLQAWPWLDSFSVYCCTNRRSKESPKMNEMKIGLKYQWHYS